MPVRAPAVLIALACIATGCPPAGITTMMVNSPMPALVSAAEASGCKVTRMDKGSFAECSDGSTFVMNDSGGIACTGPAYGDEACAEAIKRFGGVPGQKL